MLQGSEGTKMRDSLSLVFIFILLSAAGCNTSIGGGDVNCPRQELERILKNDYMTKGHNSPISYSFSYDTLDTCIINWLSFEYRPQSKQPTEFSPALRVLGKIKRLDLSGFNTISPHNMSFFHSLLKALKVEHTSLAGPLLTEDKVITFKNISTLKVLSFAELYCETLRVIDLPNLKKIDIFCDKYVDEVQLLATGTAIDTISLAGISKNIHFELKDNKANVIHFFTPDSTLHNRIIIDSDKSIKAYIHLYDRHKMKYPITDTLYVQGNK